MKGEDMNSEELKYYSFQEIMSFIGFDYEFEKESGKKFPFFKGPENVLFSWGQVLIPKTGILEMVQNKISDKEERPINEIKMMYQVPFVVDGDSGPGVINQNIKLQWRYDKTYKYGEISKSIYEVCFWILMHSRTTNDFFIISDDMIQEFFSYYVIPNQWGLGCLDVTHCCSEKFGSSSVVY